MAGNKTDPRVVKTRNSLRKALVYLMRREKLEDISVQKITETANITRELSIFTIKIKRTSSDPQLMRSLMNSLIK